MRTKVEDTTWRYADPIKRVNPHELFGSKPHDDQTMMDEPVLTFRGPFPNGTHLHMGLPPLLFVVMYLRPETAAPEGYYSVGLEEGAGVDEAIAWNYERSMWPCPVWVVD